jgi:16S rRNA (uracil1498-N3)-methyltransferase
MIRLFIAPSPIFAAGDIFPLPPDQGRYLTGVMRLSVGDEVSVFNGRDGEWTARLFEVGKKAVRLELLAQSRPQSVTPPLVLAVALIKRARLETIVEKATELGVSAIQPVITRRSNADHTNVDRLRLIAQEAAEQTERLDVPEVLPVVKLDKWLDGGTFTGLVFPDEETTHEAGAASMLDGLKAAQPGDRPAVLIGPEGGFDATERDLLRARSDVIRVNLGPRILRADTAAISALTLYQAALGDWR